MGFFLIPYLLKSQVIKTIQENTNTFVNIKNISFNPFAFSLELEGVSLSDDLNETLVSFASLDINVEPTSLVLGALKIKNITLIKPKIFVICNKDKSINLLNSFTSALAEDNNTDTEKTALPRVIIQKIEIVEGGVEYKDYTRKDLFVFSFNNIGFSLKNIDTADMQSTDAQVRFYSTLGDGGFVDFHSNIHSLEPFIVTGSLEFEASKLYTQWKYLKEQLNLEVADGKISFDTEYSFNSADINATTIKNLNLSLQRLRIIPKDGYKDVLNLDLLYVKDVEIKLFKQNVEVQKIGLKGLRVKAKRSKDKSIDWLSFIKINSNTNESGQEIDKNNTRKETVSEPWNVLIQDLALEKIQLNFIDEAIQPSVTSSVNELNIYVQNLTLSGKESMPYKLDIQVNNDLKCSSEGKIIHQNLDMDSLTSCKGFDVTHYGPYIQAFAKEVVLKHDLRLKSGVVGFVLQSKVKQVEDTISFVVTDANISVENFLLVKKSKREKLIAFKNFNTTGVHLNTLTKSLKVKKVLLKELNVYAHRYKNKSLNLDNLLVPKKVKTVVKSSKEEPYHLVLGEFFLSNSSLTFKDSSLQKTKKQKIDRLHLHVYNLDSKKRSWSTYRGGLRLNKKGNLYVNGKVCHTPLKQIGRFELKDLNLQFLNDYLQESSYLNVGEGKLSFKGKSSYAPSLSSPDLQVSSSFELNSLTLNDVRKDSPLLVLDKLQTKSITLELSPNRLYIDEVNIENFYVEAKIDENKTINFAKLAKTKEETTEVVEEKVKLEESDKNVFPIKILKVNISSGSAKFSDYSIPIKFSTYIHNLDGVIYAISNIESETTYINIAGDVDEYGSAKLEGSIEGSNPKSYTDLNLNFQNLELNSLSGYSASFAGHEIDSGKLYLDLGYDILNSELKGSNNIMMKNVVLGNEVEDENVTVLPIGFVLGLLEDSDGVIDIKMPIEGNVDEPDFKYGTLVLKTIGGLISKAVMSPFKFLGAAMGIDAEKLEYIYFEPGTSIVTPPEREKLDQISKMMLKKPKISLKLTAPYTEIYDKQALQISKLIDLVMQKSGLKNRKEHKNAMTTNLLVDIYEEVKGGDSLDKVRVELEKEYEGEVLERKYNQLLTVLCRDIQTVTTGELHALANKRALNIYNYLSEDKSMATNRLSKGEVVVVEGMANEVVALHLEIQIK
ncbi:putative exported protein [hydrothermal vent metagenome]|uniref:Putative exported protein n=1 Tax=hydrothermal vent metagenome TaxID=652676 RepID=A0A1W1BXM2_9ZZZZ